MKFLNVLSLSCFTKSGNFGFAQKLLKDFSPIICWYNLILNGEFHSPICFSFAKLSLSCFTARLPVN